MKIVADDKIPFLKGIIEPYAEIKYLPGNAITRNEILDAEAIIIRTRTECNRELLEGTQVKFVASATIGYDHIDTKYCNEKQITWTNAPGCNASSVHQYIASALIHLSHQFNFKLAGKTIGIVGVGNVGEKIEALALNLGMNVLLNDPPRERNEGTGSFVNMATLQAKSDIITLHVPLNKSGIDKTLNMVNGEFLERMKTGSFLLNSSRGKVITEDALKEALNSGKIRGAILDVWANEPTLDTELLKKICIATPHIAGYSQEGKANGTSTAIQSLSWYFNFDLHDWYPKDLPPPANPVRIIDCSGKDIESIIGDAVLGTYPIAEDHKRLIKSPDQFENLRGNYPVRREFPAHTLELLSGNEEIVALLEKIGFNIKQ